MPDLPPEAITLATDAVMASRNLVSEGSRDWAARIVTVALEAATVPLGEHTAAKILAHMETHGPPVSGLRRGSVDRHLQEQRQHAYRRHMSTAARIAASAFLAEDDTKRLAAEALARGDFVACPALEDQP